MPPKTKLVSLSYVFDPRPDYPLVSTAKRYWDPASAYLDDDDAVTLIFTHGTGFHKEQWEPAMDDLFALFDGATTDGEATGKGKIKVRELWSIDAPNHGDAAILNEKALKWGYEPVFGWQEYARSMHTFLAGLGTGVDVDFSKRKLVGIGHSMGAVCLLLSLTYSPKISFHSLILCELMTMAQRFQEKPGLMLVNGSINRRDIWPSKEEAYKLLKARSAWKVWDDRVLKIFVEDGMRPLPTDEYPDKQDGVTLKCTRTQETACYRDALGMSRAYLLLHHVVKKTPVHLVYGEINDYIPAAVKEDVINVAGGGPANFASIARVPKAGHLVVQMNPKGLAGAVYNALTVTPTTTPAPIPLQPGAQQAKL